MDKQEMAAKISNDPRFSKLNIRLSPRYNTLYVDTADAEQRAALTEMGLEDAGRDTMIWKAPRNQQPEYRPLPTEPKTEEEALDRLYQAYLQHAPLSREALERLERAGRIGHNWR